MVIGGRDQVQGRGRNIGLGAMTDKLFFVNGQRATKAEAGIPEEVGDACCGVPAAGAAPKRGGG